MPSIRQFARTAVVAVLTPAALFASTSVAAPKGDAARVAAPAVGPANCGTATGPAPARYDHIVLVIFENKSRDQIIGNSAAPYLNALANACGQATNMNATEPIASLPNYIALTSGYTGHPKPITFNRGPNAWPQDTVSIFEQLGTDWRSFAENMPSPCFTKAAYDYTVNHNPPPYYTRIAGTTCKTNNLPMPATPDISKKFTLLSPNKAHIMHEDDAPGATTQTQRTISGDAWLGSYLPKVFATPEYQAGKTVVIVTWDEGNAQRNVIPFIVASPRTPVGYQTAQFFGHYSTLKGMQEMLGLTPLLGHAGDAGVVSIRGFFGLG